MDPDDPNTNPDRRTIMEALATAGLSASVLPKIAGADQLTSKNAIETQDYVQMNDADYQINYETDRFDSENISCSGAVRWEKRKYAADASFHTWQSGSWVNACGDKRDTTQTGDIWAPATQNSRVILERGHNTETDLTFSQVYAYTDEESNDDFPNNAWVEYAFDLAWDAMDEAIPFYVPPRPPVVTEDDNETDIDADSNGATIEFYDPLPTISEEGFTGTHSVDWRWDTSGPMNPGWNHVKASREVDVGESLWNSTTGWTFGAEQTHKWGLSTAFCIYTEDETACETDNVCDVICPTSEENSINTTNNKSLELQDCCELDNIQDPIPVSTSHLSAARTKAQENINKHSDGTGSRFETQASAGLSKASETDQPRRALIAYRSAAAHGRGIDARRQLLAGKSRFDLALQHGQKLRTEIRSVHNDVQYRGKTLDEAVATAGQIEKRLVSARSWIKSAEQSVKQDYLDEEEQIKYVESSIEFAIGNLEDANFYLESSAGPDQNDPNRKDELVKIDSELRATIQSDLQSLESDMGDHVEYAADNARSYLNRASNRRDNDYYTAALVDVIYAYGYREAALQLLERDLNSVDKPTLEVEQELTADRYNRRAADVDRELERLLLKMASHEYNTGVESYGTFVTTDNQQEAARALRHYTTTEAFLDSADLIYEEFELLK